MDANQLKPGMVVKYRHNDSMSRPNRYMVIEVIEDDVVRGYRCLRNGEEGYKAQGVLRVPLNDILEIVRDSAWTDL